MPSVTVKLIEGVFSAAKKREIIRRFTDALAEIEGEYVRPVTVVTVEEVKSGDWGVGGRALTREDVRALAVGGSAG